MTNEPTEAIDLDSATPGQIERANAAVEACLDEYSMPKWDSAFGYACALTAIMQSTRPVDDVERLREARDALQAMMDTWLDYHDAHSLTQPVTGASNNAFEMALAARDKLDAALNQGSK